MTRRSRLSIGLFLIAVLVLLAGLPACRHADGKQYTTAQATVERISDSDKIELKGFVEVPFTDFAFLVGFNTLVRDIGERNELEVYHQLREEWSTTVVKVHAQSGTRAEYIREPYFPEKYPANEVPISTEVLSDNTIRISPADGTFPGSCQVVLSLDFGECLLPENEGVIGGFVARVFT